MATKNNNCKNKEEKLCSFKNWLQYADLTKIMFKEKKVWDVVDGLQTKHTIAA